MENTKPAILLHRRASVDLTKPSQLHDGLKRRSFSKHDLNTWFQIPIGPLISVKMPEKSQNLEDFTIVWLDKNADPVQFDKTRLRELINYCQIFCNMEDCLAYIHAASLEKIFFIVSGSLGQEIVPIVHDLSQVTFMYIFCADPMKHIEWTKTFNKIQGIFTAEEPLLTKLTKDVALLSNQLSSFNVFSVTKSDYYDRSIKDLNQEQATFMWFQLLIETLILLPRNSKAKYQMLDECRQYYANNKSEEKKINDFANEYAPKSAISWYTRDSFLYRLLNRALRTENIDDIFKYRFFIADLHQQINELHHDFIKKCAVSNENEILTVYRGQSMYASEFKKIEDNIGGFISINTFFSTTTSSAIAAGFVGDGSGRPLLETVMFEIDVDTRKTSKPFANIQSLSMMQNENEIIFSIGTTFQIVSVELVTDVLWHVKLFLSEKNDEQLKDVYSYLQNDFTISPPSLKTLGDFLNQMGEYEKAEHYYRLMINELSERNEDIIDIYNAIGVTYYERGLNNDAMKYYQDALDMRPSNYETLATTHINIGSLERQQCQYDAALKHYQQAVEIIESNSSKSNLLLAGVFLNIGNIYDRQGDYRISLEYYKKSLDTARSILPKYHPFFVTLHNNIGAVYDNLADYPLALDNFDGALTISQKILPANHSSLVPIYVNIGDVCRVLCSYAKALECFDKALQIELRSSPLNQDIVATIYNNIGLTLHSSSSFVKALVHFEKAQELATDPKILMSIYNNRGTTFMFLKNHEKAIENLEKAVELKMKYLDERHPSLATTYHNLAALYQTVQDYPNALKYSKKTLEIDRFTLPPNHPNLATTYNNLSLIYFKMSDYNSALEHCEEALRIMHQSSLADDHPLTNLCRITIQLTKEKLQKT